MESISSRLRPAIFFFDLFDYFLSPGESAKDSGSRVSDKTAVLFARISVRWQGSLESISDVFK